MITNAKNIGVIDSGTGEEGVDFVSESDTVRVDMLTLGDTVVELVDEVVIKLFEVELTEVVVVMLDVGVALVEVVEVELVMVVVIVGILYGGISILVIRSKVVFGHKVICVPFSNHCVAYNCA